MRSNFSALAPLAVCGAVFTLLLAGPAFAVAVEGTQATFTWAGASGPVVGYDVFVTRNDVPSTSPELVVSSSVATVTGQIDDVISVRVAAFDENGNVGPLSATSETVVLTAVAPPPAVIVEASGDFSFEDALAAAGPGEQVIAHLDGSEKQLLDAAPPEGFTGDPSEWGLDQLVVGALAQPAIVRLIDAIGLTQATPLMDLPSVTLFGLGNGLPCERDGEAGLILNPGSQLILGGVDLFAFDGQSCVHVNQLFPGSPDPNVVQWGGGEIHLYGDLEDDGVLDPDDNCLLVENPDQCDGNGNGFGNSCDFDIDGDGVVGSSDAAMLISAVRSRAADATMDLNCNGAVDPADLGMLLRGLGSEPGPSGLACAADASCPVF